MYIPVSYFGQETECLITSGGQEVITSLKNNKLVKTHIYTTPGSSSYSIATGSAYHDILIVGGGGSGGWSRLYDYAGGGGAGGVVTFNDILLSSGSHSLYVGAGGIATATNPSRSEASTGTESWLEYDYAISNNEPYTWISSSRFLAPGGGAGGYIYGSGGAPSFGIRGTDGSTGGGGVVWGDGSGPTFSVVSGISLYNKNYVVPLGFNGVPISLGVMTGTGGGGASASGSIGNIGGGAGVSINFMGIGDVQYSVGGNGRTTGQAYGPFPTSGSGGAGIKRGVSGDTLTNVYGKNGVVMIQHEVCLPQYTECSEYVIYGGALGGNLTYLPCGTTQLVSSSINPNFTGSVCIKDIYGYPSASGTVNIILTGSCNTYIPIPTTPLCSGSQVTTPSYIYDFTFKQQCYPTPSFCQQILGLGGVITYTATDGTAVTASYDFSSGGQICAREFPAPTIRCNSGAGEFGTCAITKTAVICGFWCSGSI